MNIVNQTHSEFWANYIKHKQTVFSRLEQEAFDQAQRDGKVITCHKGCGQCCVVYIEAALKECHAIAYHLRRNPEVLAFFLKQYPDWLRKTKQLGDKCNQALAQARKPDPGETVSRDLFDALLFYRLQNVSCPFLNEGSCSIYPARPFACAAHFAVTPPQWCSPRDLRHPKVYKGSFAAELADLSLDNEQLKDPGLTLMPVKVYEILQAKS